MFGVWELEEQSQREQEGHQMGMEVEAAGLLGVWPSLEYLRMPGRGDDGGRGCEPGRQVGAMKTRHCAQCKHQDWKPDRAVCLKGHKPKFFVAKTMYQAMTDDYGYKRKCADFEGKR